MNPVWSPYHLTLIWKLEAVQRRVLRLAGTRQGHHFKEVPLADLQNELLLPDLLARRKAADVLFLAKLLNGLLDCPSFLAQVDIRISSATR
ncbi:hypothetical protein J6590_092385 [Homalodisca vitripennis]|nr:hypothetical protein J6590_092385 [Homalodisca vitripennis]